MTGPLDAVSEILLGTSSWTARGWKSAFYPRGLPAARYLEYYSRHFATVEIDSTFYAIPPPETVAGWVERTPPEFLFAAKVPQVITHERALAGADDELRRFCRTMEPLGARLGPLLLQLPYFNRKQFATGGEFVDRVRAFLAGVPGGIRWALEIRNRAWIGPELLDLLSEHDVGFVLIDHPWMPRPMEYLEIVGSADRLITSDFVYVRWL